MYIDIPPALVGYFFQYICSLLPPFCASVYLYVRTCVCTCFGLCCYQLVRTYYTYSSLTTKFGIVTKLYNYNSSVLVRTIQCHFALGPNIFFYVFLFSWTSKLLCPYFKPVYYMYQPNTQYSIRYYIHINEPAVYSFVYMETSKWKSIQLQTDFYKYSNRL